MWLALILGFRLFISSSAFASNTCLTCHAEELDKPFKHQAALENCSFCHHPDHEVQTGHPHRLYEVPNKLCLKCHNLRPGGHGMGGHPLTSLEKDPLYPKKEFNCISCHNPHSSKMETLFRYDYSKKTVYRGQLCAVCHWDIVFGGRPPQAPPRFP